MRNSGIENNLVRTKTARQRGSVTVLALMVWMLLMLLVTATIALTISDNRMVHDYARNKKSFQAADSGLIHGERTLAAAMGAWTMPTATSTEEVDEWAGDAESGDRGSNRDISLLTTAVNNIDEVMPRGSVSTTWVPEAGTDGPTVDYEAMVDIFPTSVEYPDEGDIQYRHVFNYAYEITSEGEAQLAGLTNTATRVQRGDFAVEVQRPSFATYGYFTDSMKNQYNQQLVFYDGEVYEGRTHVNAEPPDGRVGFWGSAEFNGLFTAVQDTYEESFLGGNADPHFNAGAQWNVDRVELPSNGWSQLRAAIGDYANIDSNTPPTISELRAQLGLPNVQTPLDKGVYYSSNGNLGDELLGGIYVNGDAAGIKFDVDGSNQVIEIQMNNGTGGLFPGTQTWVFRHNATTGSTTVLRNGVNAGNFSGDLNGLIHVDGKVLNLKGDSDENTPDIQSKQQITLSTTGDITVGDHITYETHPDSDPHAENVLGIFSSAGNVWLKKTAPNNLKLHATVMAASDNKGVGAEGLAINGGYDSAYPNKGKWKLLGGLIEDKNQTTGVFYTSGKVTGYLWDFNYDERFAEGVAPPYFPYVTKFEVSYSGIEPGQWGRKYY